MKLTKARLQEIIKEEIGAVTEEEERDMRTRGERYGRNEEEIGFLEMIDHAISDAQQSVRVDAEVLRAFLNDALKNIL